jgi:hypothetical protein
MRRRTLLCTSALAAALLALSGADRASAGTGALASNVKSAVAAMASALGRSSSASRPFAPPSGVIAYDIYNPNQGTTPFSSSVFSDPLISGVQIQVPWEDVETASGVYDWSFLDAVFSEADTSGKFVVLTLNPGFSTPSWVLALPGVVSFQSAYSYFGVENPPRTEPVPWNTVYLDEWFAFIKVLAARYRDNQQLRMVSVSGPTSTDDEMCLPNWTKGDTALPKTYNGQTIGGSDIKMWIALGYTPEELEGAWNLAFAQYHDLFPQQYLSLALCPGLPIGDTSEIDGSEIEATELAVIATGMAYRHRFSLQENGLGPNGHSPELAYVQAHCGSVATGFQTQNPKKLGTLDQADLEAGVESGAGYLEVYETDVLSTNSASVAAIKYAAAALPADKDCGPLTLTLAASPPTSAPHQVNTITAVPGRNLLADLNFTDSNFSPAYGPFPFVADVNIFEGSHLIGECTVAMTCRPVTVSPGPENTTFEADIGPPGTTPYSSQAVVSATTVVSPGIAPSFTSAANASATVGEKLTFTVRVSGSPPPTISETSMLPAGITFRVTGPGTAYLSGQAAGPGRFALTFSAVNGVGPAAVQHFELVVLARQGYYLAGRNGAVLPSGAVPALGGFATPSSDPVTGIATSPDGRGYFAVTTDGLVHTAGDAVYRGDLLHPQKGGRIVHVSDVVSIVVTADGAGYWLLAADGEVYPFGDASFQGDLLHIPGGTQVHVTNIVGMVASPTGRGYLLIGSDGGVFAFGQVHFYGSLPGIGVKVNDIRGILPAPSYTGYVLVGSDGGAFVFGTGAPYKGSLPGEHIHVSDVVGIAITPDGQGYWMAGSNGSVYPFGDATRFSAPIGLAKALPIAAIGGT